MKVAIVLPTFTSAAYNNAFYPFYNNYFYAHSSPVVCYACTRSLFATVPAKSVWTTDPWIAPALNLLGTVNTIANKVVPNSTVDTITDFDVHNGLATNYDVLMLFHHEYLTQQEYTNIQNFVNNGGKLVAMDGNVFFAEVMLTDTTGNNIRLVSGHYWRFDGVNIATQMPDTGERWATNTLTWFGSNSDAGPTIYKYGYLNVSFGNNPFAYPAGQSGVENQFIPPANMQNVNVILDYQAHYTMTGLGNVVAYTKTYGSGSILCYGIFTDKIQTNTAFQTFFNDSMIQFLTPASPPPAPAPPPPPAPSPSPCPPCPPCP